MSTAEGIHASVIHTFQRGKLLREAALITLEPEKKASLFPHELVAYHAFHNPRFAGRVAKRLMGRYGLPLPYGINDDLATFIVCEEDILHALMTKLGVLMFLKQLPRLMKREDIETLNHVFSPSVVGFAMQNRAAAPVWPHHIIRLPDHKALHEQAQSYGWVTLVHWARVTQGEAARWLELRVPVRWLNAPVPAAIANGFREPIEKIIEDVHHQKRGSDAEDAFEPQLDLEESAYE